MRHQISGTYEVSYVLITLVLGVELVFLVAGMMADVVILSLKDCLSMFKSTLNLKFWKWLEIRAQVKRRCCLS